MSRSAAAKWSSWLPCLIIRLIIHTIRQDPSGSIWTDEAPNVSRPDPSGPDQIDVEHQATDLAVGGSNPSRRANIAVQRPCNRVLPCLRFLDCDHDVAVQAAVPTWDWNLDGARRSI